MWATSLGNIPYPILADFHPHGEMVKAYGLWNEDRGTANRAVVIVDKSGNVRFKREYTFPEIPNVADILEEVDKLG